MYVQLKKYMNNILLCAKYVDKKYGSVYLIKRKVMMIDNTSKHK